MGGVANTSPITYDCHITRNIQVNCFLGITNFWRLVGWGTPNRLVSHLHKVVVQVESITVLDCCAVNDYRYLFIQVSCSGFPRENMTLEEKQAYVDDINHADGLDLKVEEICFNAPLVSRFVVNDLNHFYTFSGLLPRYYWTGTQ